MFQGGFVGTECDLILLDESKSDGEIFGSLFPEDVNDLQTFDLPKEQIIQSTNRLQLKFKTSSDFYGRITVYLVHFDGLIN